ncbi:MAG: TonB-dependent receptor [Pseudomonadales bacterium]
MVKPNTFSARILKLSQPQVAPTLLAATIGVLSGSGYAQEEAQKGYSLPLEEVVVTAQKREENYLSVPVSVNAFTAQDMINTGAVTIQDIDDFMPGVEIGDTVGGTTQVGITVRGVTSPNISSGQDPSVATFYDDSYVPRAATSIPFSDIARTEVLKGPQGTLFGRNATVGVINIVPNSPHDEFEGFIRARVGNYNLVRLEGMINAPLSESFAVRGNILSHQRDGTIENVGIGDDTRDEGFLAARMSALWALSDATDLQLSIDLEDRDEEPRQTIGVGKYAFQGSTDPFSGKTALDVVGQEETREMYGIALKLNHDFSDQLSLFGVLSYRDWETTNLEDEDGTEDPRRYFDTNNIEESNILYSEVRFNFVEGGINLIVGANYSEEDVFQRTDIDLLADSYTQFLTVQPEVGLGQDDLIWEVFGDDEATYLALSDAFGVAVLPPSFSGEFITETIDNNGTFTNWGIFADLSYQLTDSLRIAAGLRYSNDEKDYSWQTFAKDIDWPVAPAILAYDPAQGGIATENFFNKFSDSESWSKTTGRLVVDWAFSEQAIAYLSYATGYKSGGFDGQSFQPLVTGPFDPEEIENIELGLKGDFFNNSLRMELALFHHDIEGRQQAVDAKDSPDDPTSAPRVISGEEEADGIELIVQWNVLDTLRLTAMTTYREKDEILDNYFNAAGEPAGGENVSTDADTEYTLRFDWTPELPFGFVLIHVDYVYREDPGPNEDTAIFQTGPWYFQDEKLLSARVSWQNNADTIEVALWGKNLLDEENAENPGGFVADTLGAAHTAIDDPRTYGLDLRYSF